MRRTGQSSSTSDTGPVLPGPDGTQAFIILSMPTLRVTRIASVVAVSSLALAATAPAADAPLPTGSLTAVISPRTAQRPPANGFGTPLTLKLDSRINQPGGTIYVLKSLTYKLPGGKLAKTNGAIFPSCKASVLQRAHGQLSKCPPGSRIGRGVATGTAVELGITSQGFITMFNGPGGRSITVNIDVRNPAAINSTFSAPLRKVRGKYGYISKVSVPADLQEILDGPIVVRRIQLKIGATRTIRGVKRGYIEGNRCPRSGKAAVAGEFNFKDAETAIEATTITRGNVRCNP
jgi:uncharacterized membrane protein